ncbi:glutathione S-transferase 1-1-like [Haliotis rubra]|uniref:glutathione S-transferase 1-1-like n=1 Tax=Haliotis rubra TaxID=36100 RepID=UPI001EE53F15|nr:glutathione S-transferase 1-1-like [Haliotis rubra]
MAGDSGKMKLYWYPEYRSVRPIWLIKELEAEQDFELVRFFPGGDAAHDAAYRKDVHPHCTIPALVVPGHIPILESGAICMYLADRYGKLLPEPKDKEDYYSFMLYTTATLDGILDFFFELYGMNKTFTDEKVQQMTDKLNAGFDFISRRLQGRQFICGDKFTAVDCVFGYIIYYAMVLKDGALLKNHPVLLEYRDRIQKRPHYQATINMK